MNSATLALWTTLSSQERWLKGEMTELALVQAAAPDLDPDACVAGRGLLQLAAEWCAPHLHPVDTATGPATPPDQVGLRLLERGGNPWRRFAPSDTPEWVLNGAPAAGFLNKAGLAPFVAAMDQGAWSLVTAFLAHPARPAWEDIFIGCQGPDSVAPGGSMLSMAIKNHPESLQVWVEAGLDPNFKHPVTGEPLLFMAPTPAVATWLVAHGATAKVRNRAGKTLLDVHSSGGVTQDERRQWSDVMGREAIEPRQVWTEGLLGSMARMRPLFDRPAMMKTWQWDIQDGGPPLTLHDAVAHGAIIGLSTHSQASLYNHLIKGIEGTPAAPDITWLAFRAQDEGEGPDATAERVVRAVTQWVELDRRLLAQGLAPESSSGEAFSFWLRPVQTPSQRDAILDQWLAWHTRRPERWSPSGSFLQDYSAAIRGDISTWLPRHQVAVTGHQLMNRLRTIASLLTQFHASPRALFEKKLQDAQRAMEGTLNRLFETRALAGSTFDSAAWVHLRAAVLNADRAGHLGVTRMWLAKERHRQAAQHVLTAPHRPRPRA